MGYPGLEVDTKSIFNYAHPVLSLMVPWCCSPAQAPARTPVGTVCLCNHPQQTGQICQCRALKTMEFMGKWGFGHFLWFTSNTYNYSFNCHLWWTMQVQRSVTLNGDTYVMQTHTAGRVFPLGLCTLPHGWVIGGSDLNLYLHHPRTVHGSAVSSRVGCSSVLDLWQRSWCSSCPAPKELNSY